MTKYSKLKAMKDNFIRAASKAKDSFMIALWCKRADDVQEKIDKMSIQEAGSEYKEGDVL
ncbi:MAG: hypothetical protein K6E97_03860 [Treponema sp.]|nr:hypothetical protein [Treponema sp.]